MPGGVVGQGTIDRRMGAENGLGKESILRQISVEEIQSLKSSMDAPQSLVGEAAKPNRHLYAMNTQAYKR